MSAPVVLGLDFGGSKIAAAVADLAGKRIAETTVTTDPSLGARWNLDHGLTAARVTQVTSRCLPARVLT